jgi:hypothetical protein
MTLVLPATSDAPWYDFEATLEGSTYRFELRWNGRSGAWFLSLQDAAGDVIAAGRRVVLGAQLLGRSADARLPPGTLLAVDTSGTDEEAGRDELGERVQLVYVEAEA